VINVQIAMEQLTIITLILDFAIIVKINMRLIKMIADLFAETGSSIQMKHVTMGIKLMETGARIALLIH